MERLQRIFAASGMRQPPIDSLLLDSSGQAYISSLALLEMLKHGRAAVKARLPVDAALIGRAQLVDRWLDILDKGRKPLLNGPKIHVQVRFTVVTADPRWGAGVGGALYPGVPRVGVWGHPLPGRARPRRLQVRLPAHRRPGLQAALVDSACRQAAAARRVEAMMATVRSQPLPA